MSETLMGIDKNLKGLLYARETNCIKRPLRKTNNDSERGR